jgi:hypothetical protein
MPMDLAEARGRLWARYDAGEIGADEVEARLHMLDRASDGDDAALHAALEGRIPVRYRLAPHRRGLVAAAVAVAVLAGGVGVVSALGSDDDPSGSGQSTGSGFAGPALTVVAEPGVLVDDPPDCDLGEGGDAGDELPTNSALLTDPAFVPEGYEVDDDDAIEPGTDPDIAMSISAGQPLPVEIRARVLDGDLPIRMRSFRYEDAEQAIASADSVRTSACTYAPEPFDIPDRPEINGMVITGVIPTTAFASWRLGDRRFTVAVESEGDESDDVATARQLAGAIAAAELDAARGI